MQMKYIYTNHLLERMEERFDFEWEESNKISAYQELDKIISETEEDKSYLNNSKFMLNLHDLHGYDNRYEFRSHVDRDILFVIIIERGRKIVKTCFPLSTTKFLARKSFKKVQKQNPTKKKSKKRRQSLREWEAMQEHIEINDFDLDLDFAIK